MRGVRSDLRAIVAGCDPRPISIQRYAGATEAALKATETAWHTEYEDRRINNVLLRGREYTEIFVLTSDEIEGATRFESALAAKFAREHETEMSAALAKERASAADAANELIAARAERDVAKESVRGLQAAVSGLQDRILDKDAALAAKDAALADKDAALAAKDAAMDAKAQDVAALQTALKDVLPRKTASLIAKVLRC